MFAESSSTVLSPYGARTPGVLLSRPGSESDPSLGSVPNVDKGLWAGMSVERAKSSWIPAELLVFGRSNRSCLGGGGKLHFGPPGAAS
eukprot:3649517-Rhodomonas_salina.1